MSGTPNEIAGNRIRASGLTATDSGIVAAVRHIGAIQAQLHFGAEMALLNRTEASPGEISALLASGDLVISWLNRGTLHLVARNDFWAFQSATAPSRIRTLAARFKTFGVDQEHQKRVLSNLAGRLSGTPESKESLVALMDLPKLSTPQQLKGIVAASFLELASAHGLLVRGPKSGSEPTYVSATEWVGAAQVTSPDLGDLAQRYSNSHFGATVEDFAGWLGVGLREARTAWQSPIDQGDPMIWSGLLGPFDPLLHGWKDRSWLLGEHVSRVISTNGVFRPSIIVDNECAGLWRYVGGEIELEFLEDVGTERERQIRAEATSLEHRLAGAETLD